MVRSAVGPGRRPEQVALSRERRRAGLGDQCVDLRLGQRLERAHRFKSLVEAFHTVADVDHDRGRYGQRKVRTFDWVADVAPRDALLRPLAPEAAENWRPDCRSACARIEVELMLLRPAPACIRAPTGSLWPASMPGLDPVCETEHHDTESVEPALVDRNASAVGSHTDSAAEGLPDERRTSAIFELS
jgi:hypothetical protein